MKLILFLIRGFCVLFVIQVSVAQENNPLSMYKMEMEKENVNIIELEKTISNDTLFTPFGAEKVLTTLSVSGDLTTFSKKSLVRITLIDSNGIEYLVFESNYLISDSQDFHFQNEFEETGILDNITPVFVRIQILRSKLNNLKVNYTENLTDKDNKIKTMKQNLLKYKNDKKIAQLNKRIAVLHQKWVAGETSISKLSFNEKKRIFGDTIPNLMGFDYYKGGIFEIMNDSTPPKVILRSTSTFVSDFDWRNRHGINWTTSVKDQGVNGSCWAFSAVGATEALVNLYYNKKIDLNLSEGHVLACTGPGDDCNSGNDRHALDFIKNTGVVNQSCFPTTDCSLSCGSICATPTERIKISGHNTAFFGPGDSESQLKRSIITKGVLCGVLDSWPHAMPLTGFGTVKIGDLIYISPVDSIRITSEDSLLIGKTYWIFKGSSGIEWGDNGYCNLVDDLFDLRHTSFLETPITSIGYGAEGIVCEDKDGDGYYYWGIGSRPITCPSCASLEEDGDDSNPNLGPMDEYGNIQEITTPITYPATSVTTNVSSVGITRLCGDLFVDSGGILNIEGVLFMPIHSQIIVRNGGILNVKQNSKIRYAHLTVESGGRLTLQGNAILEKGSNDEISIEVGATFECTYGEIKQVL